MPNPETCLIHICRFLIVIWAMIPLQGCGPKKIVEEETRIIPIGGKELNFVRADVVFVHGLSGDATETWQRPGRPETYWPKTISEDNPDIKVWAIDYEAHVSAWFGNTLAIQDRSIGLLEELRLQGIGKDRPIVFITHSLGGLIVKQMLRKASENEKWRYILNNTSGVMFLATPHTGSPGATLINFVEKVSPAATRSTITTEQLRSNDPYLRDLNDWYRENINHSTLHTSVLSETMPIAGLMIVPENSAQPGITGVVVTPIPEHNHLEMSQPKSRESLIYRSANDFIQQCCPQNGRVSLQEFLDRKIEDREKELKRKMKWVGIIQSTSKRQNRDTYILVGNERALKETTAENGVDEDAVAKDKEAIAKEKEALAKKIKLESANIVRAVMRPGEFIDLDPGKKIQVEGILVSTGPLGSILNDCRLLKQDAGEDTSK